MANPRIVGGSSYDNPYTQPFEAFDPSSRELSAQEIKEDPLAQVKSEFQEAQRRQRVPKPRKGVQPL